ncbi:MAG: RluA family pseudouridine synthase [Leptolyngbyaceae cyanobacterium CRU_2_3]|nr:RluA family pseudouridine synthase [Leptolyngbyaceae cyanobacterium CRU_2_3]
MLNQGWVYQEQVDRCHAGLTLLSYYTQRYRHSSQTEWQERIASEQILLNGQPVVAETILQKGQLLTYHRPPWEEPEVPLSFAILYEDADLLVIEKPSGLPVLPGGGFLEHTLLRQLQRQYPQETPVPIHRLGRGTSGLMLMARSPLARANLSQQMRQSTACLSREHPIRKVYLALVGSGDLPDCFTLTHAIGKIPHPILGYVYGATANGQFAHSECQVVKRTVNTTLLKVTLFTGRPHQIRIHLSAAGYPLLGDPLYGVGGVPLLHAVDEKYTTGEKLPVPGDCGYHLHAYQLSFTHPRTDQPINLTCPPPPGFGEGCECEAT